MRIVRKAASTVCVLLVLAGIVLAGYPLVCREITKRRQETLTQEYDRKIRRLTNKMIPGDDDLPTNALALLYAKMKEYNETLYQTGQRDLKDPFSYEMVDFSVKRFGFDEEMVGYLTVPKMKIRLPIYLGATKENMKKGAVRLSQTSLPVGGINTNTVIAAHRSYTKGQMFEGIQILKPGDSVFVTNFLGTMEYKVTQTAIIAPSDIHRVLIQDGKDMVTLITCHPARQNYQRYVVYCERAA